jgi:hypothetical protein
MAIFGKNKFHLESNFMCTFNNRFGDSRFKNIVGTRRSDVIWSWVSYTGILTMLKWEAPQRLEFFLR